MHNNCVQVFSSRFEYFWESDSRTLAEKSNVTDTGIQTATAGSQLPDWRYAYLNDEVFKIT